MYEDTVIAIEKLTKDIICALVQHPEDVKIVRTEDNAEIFFTIRVNALDMGRLIGTGGANVEAMRRILRSAGKAKGTAVILKINEPELPLNTE